MNQQLQSVETDSALVQEMVEDILSESTQELDDYMSKVRTCFIDNVEISNEDLNKIILKLPTYVYYLQAYAQRLEMKKGLAIERAKNAYNEALLNAVGKTVGDKAAQAEIQTLQDRLVQLAYKSASAQIMKKIDSVMAILDSAKKVQNARLTEMKLTGQAGSAAVTF